MGLLDDLKRQAEAAQARQQVDSDALRRNAALADAACQTVFAYFATLAQQLNVLQPTSKARYVLDRRNVVDGLRLCEFRADIRRKSPRDGELCDHVVLQYKLVSGRPLAITADFLPDIERLEARLRQSGAMFSDEAERHPESGKLLQMRYAFSADFRARLQVTPDHDQGRLQFQLVNLDALETVSVDFAASEVTTARLDDLARWVLGDPQRFLDGGARLRRVEP